MKPAVLTIAVKPNSKHSGIERNGETIVLKLRERPIENAANEACIRALAVYLNVPPSSITLLRGATSRIKQFLIASLDREEAHRRLSAILRTPP